MKTAAVPLLVASFCLAPNARAQADTAPPPEPAKPPPAPYSLPWQLRPVGVGNVVRSDTAIAFYEPEGASGGGRTITSMLLASIKVTEKLAPLVRVGVVHNSPPDVSGAPGSGFAFLNPVLGVTYAEALGPKLKLGVFVGLALPAGSGGGDEAEPEVAAALNAGVLARSAMDNAMFAVNYLTLFPGVGLAYVDAGFTAQVEVTVLRLMRARSGDEVEPDTAKTNLTSGVHVGYFFLPSLSVGAELRYQRWLSTTEKPPVEARDSLRDNLTVAFGPRFHAKLGPTSWIRPGIAYARGLDKPMTESGYHIVQIDVPVSF